MADVPSATLAGAAVSAGALADQVAALAGSLPLPADTATTVLSTCRRLRAVTAPRVRTTGDVAAIAVGLVGAVQSLARAAEASDASAGLYGLAVAAQTAFPVSASPVLTRRYALARALAATIEVAALGEAFVAEARTDFADRRAAGDARTRIGLAMDAARDRVAGALGQVVLAVLDTAAREASRHLVDRATSLQPVVLVQANASVPSTSLAWDLYGDPSRAVELVRRNAVGTPLFMPATIEAVSPGS